MLNCLATILSKDWSPRHKDFHYTFIKQRFLASVNIGLSGWYVHVRGFLPTSNSSSTIAVRRALSPSGSLWASSYIVVMWASIWPQACILWNCLALPCLFVLSLSRCDWSLFCCSAACFANLPCVAQRKQLNITQMITQMIFMNKIMMF